MFIPVITKGKLHTRLILISLHKSYFLQPVIQMVCKCCFVTPYKSFHGYTFNVNTKVIFTFH
jgi:hypothetical protein